MMISKRATGIYGSVVAATAVVAAALSGCGSSGADSTTQQTTNPAPVHGTYSPTIDPGNFSPRASQWSGPTTGTRRTARATSGTSASLV